jgi:hypothetical protein
MGSHSVRHCRPYSISAHSHWSTSYAWHSEKWAVLITSERETCPGAQSPGCLVTTSSLSPSSSRVVAASVVVVVYTSGTISGVAAPGCVYEEGASTAGLVIVGVSLATAAPAAPIEESGLGAGSPPPWVASTTGLWGPPPPVAPLSPKPWDVGVASGFIALWHTSKGQKTWVKSRKKKGKTAINVWHSTERHESAWGGEG